MMMLRLRFTRSMRLSRQRDFDAVFKAAARKSAGPLLVYARPNRLEHSRLGLSVSRRVGKAVVRNRMKRLLRESFRLDQHELPGGYDVVIVVRPHAPHTLEDYRRTLRTAMEALDRRWKDQSTSHEEQ